MTGTVTAVQVERWGWTASTRHLREQQYRQAINSYRRKHLCVRVACFCRRACYHRSHTLFTMGSETVHCSQHASRGFYYKPETRTWWREAPH
jgi:hypothetical protein